MTETPKPNLLFLFSEEHHPDVLSPAGHPHVQTPHLQRLADEGVYVRNAYCATPLCIPSRTSTLLGRFSHDTGIVDNDNRLDRMGDQPNLARNLRESGYRTCHIGKTHLGTSWDETAERLDRLGFEESIATRGKIGMAKDWEGDPYVEFQKTEGIRQRFVEDYERRAALRRQGDKSDTQPSVLKPDQTHDGWITCRAVEWLEQVQEDRPFYLSVNWAGPHVYRDPPQEYARLYSPDSMDPPIEDPMKDAPEWLRARQQEESAATGPGAWKTIRAAYYGQVSMIDNGVGRILKVLEDRDLLEDTLIVFTADHGEMLLDHGMIGKTLLYESSVRVPFLARYPKAFPGGSRPGSMLSLVDLAPTFLEWAGAAPLPVMHGQTLTPLLTGREDNRTTVFSEFKGMKMVRQGSWKLVTDPEGECDQLFDLTQDPDELHNLAATEPGKKTKLKQQLHEWICSTTAP